MALIVKDAEEYTVAAGEVQREVGAVEEEEEELFEINLEAVNSIPPPHYWESYFTATTNALLANCLLPIADVSSAIPSATLAGACDDALPMTWPTSLLVVESVPQKSPGHPVRASLGVFALQFKEAKP